LVVWPPRRTARRGRRSTSTSSIAAPPRTSIAWSSPLTPYHPYLRGGPPGLPFRWNAATIRSGLNFTLTADIGDLDLLGEVTGGGSYDMLAASTVLIRAFGTDCRLLNLDRLIEVKRASGRPKDFEVIAELETIRDSERARGSK
jgi:hypothetical protein